MWNIISANPEYQEVVHEISKILFTLKTDPYNEDLLHQLGLYIESLAETWVLQDEEFSKLIIDKVWQDPWLLARIFFMVIWVAHYNLDDSLLIQEANRYNQIIIWNIAETSFQI